MTGGQLHSINCQMLNCFVTQSLRLFASQYFEQDVMFCRRIFFGRRYFEQGVMFCRQIFFGPSIFRARCYAFADESFFPVYISSRALCFAEIFFPVNIWSRVLWFADESFFGRRYFEQGIILFCPRIFFPSIFQAGRYVLQTIFSLF